MSYDDGCKITRHTNGFEVSLRDPKIVAANRKRDAEPYDSKKPRTPWQEPNKTFVFKTAKEVTTFLEANIDKMLPEADYETSFDLAAAECD